MPYPKRLIPLHLSASTIMSVQPTKLHYFLQKIANVTCDSFVVHLVERHALLVEPIRSSRQAPSKLHHSSTVEVIQRPWWRLSLIRLIRRLALLVEHWGKESQAPSRQKGVDKRYQNCIITLQKLTSFIGAIIIDSSHQAPFINS